MKCSSTGQKSAEAKESTKVARWKSSCVVSQAHLPWVEHAPRLWARRDQGRDLFNSGKSITGISQAGENFRDFHRHHYTLHASPMTQRFNCLIWMKAAHPGKWHTVPAKSPKIWCSITSEHKLWVSTVILNTVINFVHHCRLRLFYY